MNHSNTPYASLEPAVILDAIESVGFRCTGSLFALNSFENRVYQIGIEESEPVIAKFYRPARWSKEAILEEHAFTAELLDQEIPVVAPLVSPVTGSTLNEYQGFLFALFPRKGGRTLELDNLSHLEWMGRFIGRLHAVGAMRPFKHRIKLDVQSYGYQPYQFLLQNNFIPESIKSKYCNIMEQLLQKVESNIQQAGEIRYLRIHGDCHAGNVLWNPEGPQIVDLDDCLMGPAVQDIWMLLSGNTRQEVDIQLDHLLRGYQTFHDFNYSELHIIESLRALRLVHYSAWLARRWEDPAFPLNFPWFNTPHYWREQLDDLEEQILLLDEVGNQTTEADED